MDKASNTMNANLKRPSLPRKFFLAVSKMSPVSMLQLILSSAFLITIVVTAGVGVDWSTLMPYFTHHHPRLCLCIMLLYGGLVVFASGPLHSAIMSRVATRPAKRQLKLQNYLNNPLKMEVRTPGPDTWKLFKEDFDGEVIKTADTRSARWEVTTMNDVRQEATMSLWYSHTPLGRKPWERWSRLLTCSVKIKGKGVRSDVELTFNSRFPMDYKTVSEIVEQTQAKMVSVLECARTT